MDLRFSYDQRARLELLAIHAGVTLEQLLMEAAELLLEREAADAPVPIEPRHQNFLSNVELDERLLRLLRH